MTAILSVLKANWRLSSPALFLLLIGAGVLLLYVKRSASLGDRSERPSNRRACPGVSGQACVCARVGARARVRADHLAELFVGSLRTRERQPRFRDFSEGAIGQEEHEREEK